MAERRTLLLLGCLGVCLLLLDHVNASRLKGSVSYSTRSRKLVLFLTKFGVISGRDVYVYGKAERNLDHPIGFASRMTLVFIPQSTWNHFYPRSNVLPTSIDCQNLMNTTLSSSIIVGETSCISGFDDYLRKLPCNPHGEHYSYCNQPDTVNVTRGSDFTYHVRNSPSTEFYYLFVVACSRNATETCDWGYSDEVYFNYDISVVNSDPTGHKNLFEYHFSYEYHGILILEMTVTVIYLISVIVHFALQSKPVAGKGYSTHRLIDLFSASLVLELFHVSFVLMHFSVYAANGSGVVAMRYLGEIFNELSDWLLILVLILIAKGWQVTTCSIRWKKLTSIVWGVYIFVSAIYFVWMVVKEQVYPLSSQVEHSFQSWVGAIYLVYRMIVLVYSLYGMRQMYLIENRATKLKLYVVLAIVYLVWFIYLPVAVILAFAVNPVLRFLFMRSIILVFDLSINLFMVGLFCPKWSDKFFQFDSHINQLSKTSYSKLSGSYGSAPQII